MKKDKDTKIDYSAYDKKFRIGVEETIREEGLLMICKIRELLKEDKTEFKQLWVKKIFSIMTLSIFIIASVMFFITGTSLLLSLAPIIPSFFLIRELNDVLFDLKLVKISIWASEVTLDVYSKMAY